MRCRDCAYFPCTKIQCNIGNKEECNDFESIVEKVSKEMENKWEK